MFESSLVESTSMLRHRSRWPVLFSVLAQAFAAAALIAVPLLHPEALSMAQMHTAALLPPIPPHTPPQPPPARPVHVVLAASDAMAAPATHAATLPSTPSFITAGPIPPIDSGFTTGIGSADPLSAIATTMGAPSGRAVAMAPTGTVGSGRPRISTGVSAGMLLVPIVPIYPRIAQMSRVEGTVIVDAIITKSGRIASAHVTSGPAMLQGAAVEAVRSARYRPYLLNGEPAEVETTISIVFHMAG